MNCFAGLQLNFCGVVRTKYDKRRMAYKPIVR